MAHHNEYIDLQKDFNELLGWYRQDQKEIIFLKASADRRLELLVAAEQTLRNLANGWLEGDAKLIASNAAANIRKELENATLGG